MNHWIMDYETLTNCFVGVFQHYKTKERKVFVLHDLQDDFTPLLTFLKQNRKDKEWHISFNGLAFDAQITHYILDNEHMWMAHTACEIAHDIYLFAQQCINAKHSGEYLKYAEWKMKIQQIDLFKLNHWDNVSKKSSLKWIQFSMDWDNLLDMPIKHTTKINTQEELDIIIEYCINDVESTYEIYKRSKSQINLRKKLSDKYKINLFSASEPRISKEIFMYYMAKKMNMTKYDFKKLRTERKYIKCKDIILPYIKFKSYEFNGLLNNLLNKKLDASNLKGQFNFSVNYKGVNTHFGLGGVHGAIDSGIYESDDEYIIMSSDVTSFYPNLVIRNQWSPKHFPKELFCPQYEWFFDERVKIPKSNPMNYVLKIILNSTFGLSNDATSFFYDPELCMRITINGQLTLMMLYEMIMEEIPDAISLMQNTDGIEIKIPKIYKDKYLEICSRWEKLTKLKLEHETYSKMIIADVNNYIAVQNFVETDINTWRNIKDSNPHYIFKIEGSSFKYAPVKLKGRFNFHDLALHKNKSKLVVPKALYQYFINNVLPKDYIKSNTNIIDYCIAQKSRGEWIQTKRFVKDGNVIDVSIQKTNRYYISEDGYKIIKVNKFDNREIQLESGKWKQKLFNKIVVKNKFSDYNINKKYYIQAIENEINNILKYNRNQLTIF
jgi:hypothetical protein